MLKCEDIQKQYLNKAVVNHVTLELEKGRIYALLGQNGSGKSTLMKIIAGLVKMDHGDVSLEGLKIGVKTKGLIAFLPTETYYYDYMKVEDVQKYYKDFFSDFCVDRFCNLRKRMQLNSKDKVKHMSSGEIAKLKLAVTLARDARLYLLDEPLNGIDLISRDIITTTILEVASEDNTIIISSHLIEEIESIVDHVIILDQGCVCLVGDAEEIREQRGISIVDLYREMLA